MKRKRKGSTSAKSHASKKRRVAAGKAALAPSAAWEKLLQGRVDSPQQQIEIPFQDRLHVCEESNFDTITRLALTANCSILELESRRNEYRDHSKTVCATSDTMPADRRRCATCPWWKRHPDRHPWE